VLQQINLNSRLARGIDFDLSYRSEIGSGELGARAQFSRTLDYIDTVGGVKTQQAGFYNTGNQLSLPKWRGNVSLDYTIGAFSLFVQERYIGSITQMPPLPGQVFAKPKIGAVFYTDITATMKVQGLGGDLEIYGTVNNLFNRKPPFIGNRFAAGLGFPTPPNLYDLDNRYFTVGARVKF
jgi:iron complex outermembrane recepter protein